MTMDIHYSSKSNEWETPKYIFDFYNKIYNFNLDAAATKDNALCKNYFTKEDNSLNLDWSKFKFIWCNPPYGREIGKFIKKGYEESLKDCIVVFLIPARVDTKWWHEYCSKGQVKFIKGRLKFENRTFPSWRDSDVSHKISPAPFPSAIVIFDNNKQPSTEYIEIKNV